MSAKIPARPPGFRGCSVIIPVYNGQRYLAECIESALAQTYRDTEIVVVDDGSTDATASIIERYSGQIVSITQKNLGLAAARNVAIKKAKGQYIALLDADDIWLPKRLERTIGYLEENPQIGFATSDAFLIHEELPSLRTYYEECVPIKRFYSEEQNYWILRHNFVFVMAVIRRELFDQHGYFDETLKTCEDWDLWIRFLVGGEQVGLVDLPLAYYRVRTDSLSRSTQFQQDLSHLPSRLIRMRDVQSVPGLGRDLYLPKARAALREARYDDARLLLRAASRDPKLSLFARVKARSAALMPRAARPFSHLSFRVFTDLKIMKDSRGRTYRMHPGGFEGYVESQPKDLSIFGWTVQRGSHEPVDWVVVFRNGKFAAIAEPTDLRVDVGAHLKTELPPSCGFRVSFDEQFAVERGTLSIFAVNHQSFGELPWLQHEDS